MAEVKVSALTALTGANVANGDELYIVDTGSPNVSKKITADELAQMPQLSSRYAPLPGAWTAWTPTVTASSGTITTVGTTNCRYMVMGKLMIGRFIIPITTLGSGSGQLLFTLPSGLTAQSNYTYDGVGVWVETIVTGASGAVLVDSNDDKLALQNVDGTGVLVGNGREYRGTFTLELA